MATLLHTESRRMYSWWWDSHISPKNSKWLQENLTGMDDKVKAMIKLLEEDADSFARRAEMYYKKRPELMALVEEFYRAYRALAERYDHATGALRQAHRTMAEAFPNQIPLMLPDESPSGSSISDVEPRTPEIFIPLRPFSDSDDLHKDTSPYHTIKKDGTFSEEKKLISRKGLKQLNEMFLKGEGLARGKFSEGKVRKGLNFQDDEQKCPDHQLTNSSQVQSLDFQEEFSHLSREINSLKCQVTSESERADKAANEIVSLKEMVSQLKSEKKSALLQYHESAERISNLEIELSRTQSDLKKLNNEMIKETTKLRIAEDQCLLLKKANKYLKSDFESLEDKAKLQQHELDKKQEELNKLALSLKTFETLQCESHDQIQNLCVNIESGIQQLKIVELNHISLVEEMHRLKEENLRLHEQAQKLGNLQLELNLMKEKDEKLDEEVRFHMEEKKVLQQELSLLKEDTASLEKKYEHTQEEMNLMSFNLESVQTLTKDLQGENAYLKEVCKRYEDDKLLACEKISNMEKIYEKNEVLETSLSDANVELEELRKKLHSLHASCDTLGEQLSTHISEKDVLITQLKTNAHDMKMLSEIKTFLENSLSDVNSELENLKLKIKGLEEANQILNDEKVNLLAEKNVLVSQVQARSGEVAKLSEKNALLEKSFDDRNAKFETQEVLVKDLERLCYSLNVEKSSISAEKNNLALQIEATCGNIEKLLETSISLETVRNGSTESEVHSMKLKNLEGCFDFLYDEYTNILMEKDLLISQVKAASENVEKLSEENATLDKSFSDTLSELEDTRRKLRSLKDLYHKLSVENSNLLVEKNALASEVERTTQSFRSISENNGLLEKSMDKATSELDVLRGKFQGLEDSCQTLRDENSILLAEKSSLLSQVKAATEGVKKLAEKNATLDKLFCDASSELVEMRGCMRSLEDLYQNLCDEKSNLLAEKNDLASEVEKSAESLKSLSENNGLLEKLLYEATSEREDLRVKYEVLEDSCRTLHDENSNLIAEKTSLTSQVEAASKNVVNVLEENASLKRSLIDATTELEVLRVNLRGLEDSWQNLCNENFNLIAEKKTMSSEVGSALQNTEKLSEKNVILEISLLNAIDELEDLRVKLRCSEDSYQTLCHENCSLLADKSKLTSQVHAAEEHMKNLSVMNATLEISLSDVHNELDDVRLKMEELEESLVLLSEEKFVLSSQNNALIFKVESLNLDLEEVEKEYLKLTEKLFNLQCEEVFRINQFMKLEEFLKVENHEHETLIQSSKSRITCLLDEVRLKQEENHLGKHELELVQELLLHTQTERFIFERCLLDTNDMNLNISGEYLKQLEALRYAENQNLELKKEICAEKERVASLIKYNEKLGIGISSLWMALSMNTKQGPHNGLKDLMLLQLVMDELTDLINSFSDVQDENQQLHIEKSILWTILQQLIQEIVHVRGKDLQISDQRESVLKAEIRILFAKLTNLQGSSSELHINLCKFTDENKLLSKKINDLSQERDADEQEISIIHEETMRLECLYLIFSGLCDQRASELTSLSNDMKYEVSILQEKIEDLQAENMELKESISVLEDDLIVAQKQCQQLNLQNENDKHVMMQKDMMLLEASNKMEEVHKISQDKICQLTGEVQSLSQKLYYLKEKKEEVEEECSAILGELTAAKCISSYFRSLNSERALLLVSCRDGMDYLFVLNNHLNREIRTLGEKMEALVEEKIQLRDAVISLERLNATYLTTNSKIMDENNAILLQALTVDFLYLYFRELSSDRRLQLELLTDNLNSLSEIKNGLDEEIRNLNERLELLSAEKMCLKESVENWSHELSVVRNMCEELTIKIENGTNLLANRENILTLEVEEGKDKVKKCEEVITAFLSGIHISVVNAAIFEEQVLESIVEYESLVIYSLVEKQMMYEDLDAQSVYANSLMGKLNYLEGENRELKDSFSALLPLIASLGNAMASLEKLITSFVKIPRLKLEKEELSIRDDEGCEKLAEDPGSSREPTVESYLNNLLAKVQVLQTMVINNMTSLQMGTLPSSADLEEQCTDFSRTNHAQKMKDIQLDQISNFRSSKTEDQMLELWETAERDCNNKINRPSGSSSEKDIPYPEIETVDEDKSEHPSSELISEKELGVDKLELRKLNESHQQWKSKIIERLTCDAQRLQILQRNVQELKARMESPDKGKIPVNPELNAVRAQLKEAEGAVLQLTDINSRMKSKVEDCNAFPNKLVLEKEDFQRMEKLRLSERARRGSEKIESLELELQKIQYILLKLEEEHDNRIKAMERRSSTLLREYLYGRKDNRRRKRGVFCGCMRPKTKV